MTHEANMPSTCAAPPLRTAQHPRQDLSLGVTMVSKVEKGEAVSSGNTHAAARWWLWQPSGDDAALSLHTELPLLMSHNMRTSTIMNLLGFFSLSLYNITLLWPLLNKSLSHCLACCGQTYSLSTCFVLFFFFLLLCSQRASQQVIHPPPGTSMLRWHAIDHPSPHTPPHLGYHLPQTCQQHVSKQLCLHCLAVRLCLSLTMIYCIITQGDSGY